MKQRFSSLDVRIIAHELSHSLVSLRLANVYDLSSRIFLFKFAKPDHREQFVVDSGFRCHLTKFARATAAAPSPFVARLRKFLRTRRCTAVRQVGTDRVIELQFSDGAYRLFLEFYAGGNIVLADSDLTILGLLRSVNEGEEHEQYRLGVKYSLAARQNVDGVPALTKERLLDGLNKAAERQQKEALKVNKKANQKKSLNTLSKALAGSMSEFPPVLIDHALHVAGIEKTLEIEKALESGDLQEKILAALRDAGKIVDDITQGDVAKGYVLGKRKQNAREEETDGVEGENQGVMYEDFHPFKPSQLAANESNVFLEYEGFNRTVDEFFSSIEGQKLESRLQEREDNAKRRIEAARQEQEKRIDGLQQVQELNIRKAQAIEANVERVEEAVAAVNGLIAQGMDWVDIGRLIENEQSRRNPVAEMIKTPLKLHENTVTLLLSELAEADEEEMDETDSEASDSDDDNQQNAASSQGQDKRLAIDVDLSSSAWSNARQYYDQRRTAAVKQEKTAQASQKALKSTEQKVMADLKKGLKQEKDVLRPVRKQFWFEKFIYFISSDGYLVLAGKDAQQNEILYRRYLRKGDVYVHADMHGAASIIIKNNPSTPEAPIPPSTLSQAGNLAVCTSTAWDSKAVMSAWWVNADQVSKTAPTGEYLTTGGFMVRGKKNFLPPAQLLLGFALAFHISEESKARHVKHRLQDRPQAALDGEGADAAADNEDEGSDDDEFPDAGPAAGMDDDDDDEFPDAQPQAEEASDGESPEPHRETSAHEDEDREYRFGQSNPLQTNGNATEGNQTEHDETADEEEDTDEAAEGDNADPSGDKAGKTEEAPDGETQAEVDEEGDGAAEEAPKLTNRERKMANRLELGKPIHNEQKVKPSKGARGRKGKNKKIAQKYADQDEEDRQLAMKLLGSKAGEERRQQAAQEKTEQKESAEEARARRRAQHEKAQKEGLEAEEIRRLNLEEGIEGLNDEESSELTQLDALIGTPLPGDEILDAIPICAPWGALNKFKYKAKMQPGQQKKGKATREILGKWTKDAANPKAIDHQSQDTERIWPREAELIKGLKEPEVVGVIPVKNVRVMMSGGGAEKGKGGGKGGKGGRGGRGGKKK